MSEPTDLNDYDKDQDAYDAAWKAENKAILDRAQTMPTGTMSEGMMALAMLARFAECERVRLGCREAVLRQREARR